MIFSVLSIIWRSLFLYLFSSWHIFLLSIPWTRDPLIATIIWVEIIIWNITVITAINWRLIEDLLSRLMTWLKIYIVLVFRISCRSQFWVVEMLNFFGENLFVFFEISFIWSTPPIYIRIISKFFLEFTLNFLIVDPTNVLMFLNLSIMFSL